MPDITQRIADILKRHTLTDAPTWANERICFCGAEGLHTLITARSWERHVAEVLTTELGLRQEWSVGTCGKQIMMSERAAKIKAAHWPESFEASSRYVTDWVAE